MAAADDITTTLAKLAAEIDDEERDDEVVLELAEKAIEQGVPAEHQTEVDLCKAVALVNLSKYAECLEVCKKAKDGAGGPHADSFRIVKAYSLYKTEALEDAYKIADAAADDDEALMQVKAQTLYRQGKFLESVRAFKEVKDVLDDEGSTVFLCSFRGNFDRFVGVASYDGVGG